MANSLALIARALSVIVRKEYHIDIEAPMPSRSELAAEILEPMYPDNLQEAIREERERIEQAELDAASTGSGRLDARKHDLVLTFAKGGRAGGELDELTPEEARFLSELEERDDER